jgi:DNA-directed RNA polymerase subunit omega
MARITVEDCIRHYPNRFEMVLLASRRARQLMRGFPPLVKVESHKPVVNALKEIGEGMITWELLYDLEERERRRLESAEPKEEEDSTFSSWQASGAQ